MAIMHTLLRMDDRIESNTLFDQALKMGVEAEDIDNEEDPEDIRRAITALLKAADALRMLEKGEDWQPLQTAEDENQAWSAFQKSYFKAWPEVRDVDGMGWIPDGVPGNGLPIRFYRRLGTLCAASDKARDRAMMEYFAAQADA